MNQVFLSMSIDGMVASSRAHTIVTESRPFDFFLLLGLSTFKIQGWRGGSLSS